MLLLEKISYLSLKTINVSKEKRGCVIMHMSVTDEDMDVLRMEGKFTKNKSSVVRDKEWTWKFSYL